MKYQLLTEEDVLKAGLGEDFSLNITETAKTSFQRVKENPLLKQAKGYRQPNE
jgi:hypothetical protein